ncbi:MAG: DEAD/DEAH box helicase [Gemmataceae bacterium]
MTTATKPERPTSFSQINLEPALLRKLEQAGYHKPSPIQAYAVPRVLTGRDVIGQAQTGTGKTAAFLLPFLNNWQDCGSKGPQALVLAPTRELASQIVAEFGKLAPDPKCKAVAIYGGASMKGQLSQMDRGFAMAIGTPGRVIDHIRRGTLDLRGIKYLVLDEADRMLDIGFRPDIERILRRVPHERQTLLFSATLPPEVLKLATRYMVKPIHISLAPKKPTVDKIRQTYLTVDKERKFDLLVKVFEREQPKQCIIFCERKIWAQRLYEQLVRFEPNSAAMHGDLLQSQRERIMKAFRDGKLKYLVATDVVGRGIDVTGISHIINYDLPEDPESYVHRIGRTGRMGKDGIAIAFVTREQGEQLTRIEAFINRELAKDPGIEGFEAVAPKVATEAEAPPFVPVFGSKRNRRYSKRL